MYIGLMKSVKFRFILLKCFFLLFVCTNRFSGHCTQCDAVQCWKRFDVRGGSRAIRCGGSRSSAEGAGSL